MAGRLLAPIDYLATGWLICKHSGDLAATFQLYHLFPFTEEAQSRESRPLKCSLAAGLGWPVLAVSLVCLIYEPGDNKEPPLL